MSLEITLYSKTSSKNKLIQFLTANGFERARYFIDALSDKNHIHFMWFGYEDFESFTGVEAMVVKVTADEVRKYKCSNWILHTRTRSSGSQKDKEKQNQIIKDARKLFGGNFYNDWYGANKYTNIYDYPTLTAPERGLMIMYHNLHDKIKNLRYSLKDYENPFTQYLENMPDDEIKEFVKMQDPSITFYNALLPFNIALIEYLFGQTFEILIKYDSYSKKIIEEENLKIPLKDVLAIKRNELDLESVISRDYTFQNLSHVNKAYKKYINIDIFKILSRRKKVGNRFYLIREKLEEIIKRRHSMIHQFEFDLTLTKREFLEILDIIDITIKLVIDAIEKKYKWNIKLLP